VGSKQYGVSVTMPKAEWEKRTSPLEYHINAFPGVFRLFSAHAVVCNRMHFLRLIASKIVVA
jgi:hypothetical protein